MTEPRVHVRHARQVPGARGVTCAPGIRTWCTQNNIDVNAFLREGIPGEECLRIGGHFALTALDIARKEATRG